MLQAGFKGREEPPHRELSWRSILRHRSDCINSDRKHSPENGTLTSEGPLSSASKSDQPGAGKVLTERLSASAPCWPWRHAVSFLCVLWETCFTSSRRFSTCAQTGGDVTGCGQGGGGGGSRSGHQGKVCRVLLQTGDCREPSRSVGPEGAYSQTMGPLLTP